ncbi:RecQ family ATP-dependent DNA helicase [Acidicapsa dinghuensis]|uniref:ATP-dependent DNA helicase RecQ n=1 Tax=Acidicapsa dinghuensis TaxID=2218256 RepID=A0ABW1EL14_9BACT|nr:ATP-dependent DNA helicase RecQ [Acidicapsa dinghuensis]
MSAAATLPDPSGSDSSDSDPSEFRGSLTALLLQAFGFPSFRANQEAVCRAAIDGHDLLLVMPTGSGKSLCYQLPAIARGGTALVVSPLIALMEDQCAKLTAQGFRVARIHSGLDRSVSRQACIDYLNGGIQFLFIAPERLRVPGFPEMLAKRKPSLIAIDEAHCISQWGHDFRPDYRMLGQYLPALRPAPVLALTATATPTVQRDILTQLGLQNARKFIHGFRRSNLAIEVTEVPQPMRGDKIAELLTNPSHRPAIVYAPARKRAEELAAQLNHLFPTAAYHAGLPAEIRDSVQQSFLSGKLQCVVATIAFGMGIDKANVRTVIHAALPSTIEGYYQEIGRAGRDGNPSRAILMHSYADIRTHDFFLKRDYPPIDIVQKVFNSLGNEPQPLDDLRAALAAQVDDETFSIAVEKLFIHGGAQVDFNNNATRGHANWSAPYNRQSDHRRSQLDLVQRYVDGHECRMAALVQHFGDTADGRTRCGICDFCNPSATSLQQHRTATSSELRNLREILDSLRSTQGKSTGRLQKELSANLTRKELDVYLSVLSRAGIITVEDAEWIKDGETILFRKAALTAYGEESGEAELCKLLMPGNPASNLATDAKSTRKSRSSKDSSLFATESPAKRAPSKKPDQDSAESIELTPAAQQLEQALKAWRTSVAKKLGMPPFVVLHDRTLRAIAQACPTTPNELQDIPGMGPTKLDKYGHQILSLCREA